MRIEKSCKALRRGSVSLSITVCMLASGSSGNCTYVASERTRILIDAGLSGKETGARLESIGVNLDDIDAICVTHEHSDHKSGLAVLQRRCGVELYGNAGTIDAISQDSKMKGLDWNVFTTGQPFNIGDLHIEPFSVPHDSLDPVGFVVSCEGVRIGAVTDMGMVTELIKERLKQCDVFVIESNHDEQMLKESQRPWSLKQRILGRQGHLSNGQAASLISEVTSPRLKAVFLAHLSSDCNTRDLARAAVEEVLSGSDVVVEVARRSKICEPLVIQGS